MGVGGKGLGVGCLVLGAGGWGLRLGVWGLGSWIWGWGLGIEGWVDLKREPSKPKHQPRHASPLPPTRKERIFPKMNTTGLPEANSNPLTLSPEP